MFAHGEPDTPDECITVYDTLGTQDGRSMVSGEQYSHKGIQVRVRSGTSTDGFVKAQAISNSLDQSTYQEVLTIGGVRYFIQAVSTKGDPIPLGRETPKSKRFLYTINATVAYHQL